MAYGYTIKRKIYAGLVKSAARNKVPLVVIPEAEDDAMTKFSGGRWPYPPVSDPVEWWKYLPVRWKVVIAEFGSKTRGMINRVPKETWIGAHDRGRCWELKHWSSTNTHSYKNEKTTSFEVCLQIYI